MSYVGKAYAGVYDHYDFHNRGYEMSSRGMNSRPSCKNCNHLWI